MLSYRKMQIKSYDDLMDEAIKQIPLYTKEWTNFNASDPGITVLENLSALNVVQAEDIEKISPAIRERLLKMAGFERRQGGLSRVLLEAKGIKEKCMLMANERFMLGTTSFETSHAVTLSGYSLTGVFASHDGKISDVSYLNDREVPLASAIFGSDPHAGDCIYIVADGMPDPGEEAIFYIRASEDVQRNPSAEGSHSDRMFASMKWECFTETGYAEADFRDTTGCFIRSGEIHIRMPQIEAEECSELPVKGYVLKGTLMSVDYDIAPSIRSISGFLFEVWQKETQSICYTFNKASKIEAAGDILESGYMSVYCREEKNGPYFRYSEFPGGDAQGRFYVKSRLGRGQYAFEFDKKKYGFAPTYTKNAVKLVAYNEFSMRHYRLGSVEGYDDQEIDLPFRRIVPDTFSLIAERTNENNENIYEFVKSDRNTDGSLYFTIDEGAGKITIRDAGDFIGASLYLCAAAITGGPEGNVRADNEFVAASLPDGCRFTNPAPGAGGAFRETIEELRRRFVQDVDTPATAVTAADYEMLVKNTPELCIDRVHAWADKGNHVIHIAVRPVSSERFAKISPLYLQAMKNEIEKHRLVNTTVKITEPSYAAVNVSGMVYVRTYAGTDTSKIEKVIRDYIDFDVSGRNFGEMVHFDELFNRLEALDIVEYVDNLELSPQDTELAVKSGMDIKPYDGALTCTGLINLEIIHK